MIRAAVAATLVVLGPAASLADAGAGASAGSDAERSGEASRPAPRLSVFAPAPGQGAAAGVASVAGATPGRGLGVCPLDWCQPQVDVPGMTTARASPSRPELAAALLDAARLESLAHLAWLFARTGLEVQYKPPGMAGGIGTGTRGRGDVMVWLKLRLDPFLRPSFPGRPVSVPHA